MKEKGGNLSVGGLKEVEASSWPWVESERWEVECSAGVGQSNKRRAG
jgi:hypothetical protein